MGVCQRAHLISRAMHCRAAGKLPTKWHNQHVFISANVATGKLPFSRLTESWFSGMERRMAQATCKYQSMYAYVTAHQNVKSISADSSVSIYTHLQVFIAKYATFHTLTILLRSLCADMQVLRLIMRGRCFKTINNNQFLYNKNIDNLL